MSNTYYIYALLDPRKPTTEYECYGFTHEPFYIGYGHGSRDTWHARNAFKMKPDGSYLDQTRKAKKLRKILSEGHQVIITRTSNTTKSADRAKRSEVRLIAAIGRLDTGEGPLTNGTAGGDGLANPSAKTRARMSRAKKGIPRSEEHNQKLRDYFASPEGKAKAREAQLGKKHSESTKLKMSRAHVGKVFTEEHKENMRSYVKTAEHRRKLSESHTGKVLSEETRSKISESKKGQGVGRKHSEESKEKMRGAKTPEQVANMKKAQQARVIRERDNPSNGKKVRIGKRIFNSVGLAAQHIGLKHNSMLYRIASPNFPDIAYV